MQKYNSGNFKKFQAGKKNFKNPQDKSVKRFWGNASRLERANNRGKNR